MYHYRMIQEVKGKDSKEKNKFAEEYRRKRFSIVQKYEFKRLKSVNLLIVFSIVNFGIFFYLSQYYCFDFADFIARVSLYVFISSLVGRLIHKKVHSFRNERKNSDMNKEFYNLISDYNRKCPEACLDYIRKYGCGDRDENGEPVCSVDLTPLTYFDFSKCEEGGYHCFNCPKINNVFWED